MNAYELYHLIKIKEDGGIVFSHPDPKMLENQFAVKFIEAFRDFESLQKGETNLTIEQIIDKHAKRLVRILEGRAGF